MASLPTTIDVAIKLIRKQHPEASVEDIVQRLLDRGWNFNPLDVAKHVAGSQPAGEEAAPRLAKAERSVGPRTFSGSLPSLQGALSLDALPETLRRSVEADPDAFSVPMPEPVTPMRREAPGWRECRLDMMAALSDELSIAHQRFDDARIPVSAGKVLGHTRDGLTVRYDMEQDAPLIDGSQVRIYFQGVAVEAEVVSVTGMSLTLWLRDAGTAPVPRATVVVDVSFLLRKRREFLSILAAGGKYFDVASALSVLENRQVPITAVHFQDSHLTVEQNQFVRLALAGGLSWLWGPPGTGKTTTLAYLVKELRQRDKRVLFVSNTNTAVDTALLRYLGVDEPQPLGSVLRLGEPALAEVRDVDGTHVLAEEVVAQRGEEVARHLVECKRELAILRRRHNNVRDVIRDPLKARDKGLIGTPEDDLFDLHALMDAQDFYDQQQELPVQIGHLIERKKTLEALVKRLTASLIGHARLVFATVHRTYMQDLANQRFDVVIIDEASMVSTDLAVIAAGFCSGHVVIAGDFRQLGPIALTQSAEGRRWLRASAFERAGMSGALNGGRSSLPTNLVALRTQHRMRSSIASLVGDTFYREVGLETGDSVLARPTVTGGRYAEDLILIDTSSLRPWMGKRNGRWSRYNIAHAQVIASLLNGVPKTASVGVVAPFAPQASLLRTVMGQEDAHRSASTIHRFQGGERDVLFWDMTEGRAGGRKITSWFESRYEHEEGSRLINVALSRARDQLFVIADMDRAKTACAHGTVVRKVLDRIERDGVVIDATQVLEEGPGATSLFRGVRPHDPFSELLRRTTGWVSVWVSSPPREIGPGVLKELSAARRRGVQVYVRSGVPGSRAEHSAMSALQDSGCSVRYVKPCWENVAVSENQVLSSSGGLLGIAPLQLSLATTDGAMADAVTRLLKRKSGPSEEAGELDELCALGHPKLLEHAQLADYTHVCPACDFGSTPRVRTGRSRSRSAAVTTRFVCRSCNSVFGIDGRCAC